MKKMRMFGRLLLAMFVAAIVGMFKAPVAEAVVISTNFYTHSLASNQLAVFGGENLSYAISGTFVGQVKFQKSSNASSWEDVVVILSSFSTNPPLTGNIFVDEAKGRRMFYRIYASTHTSGTIVGRLEDVDDVVQEALNLKGVTNLKLKDDGVVVPGYLNVSSGAVVTGSLSTYSPFQPLLKTSLEISSLLPATSGLLLLNISTGRVCVSSAGAGGWYYDVSLASGTIVKVPCY